MATIRLTETQYNTAWHHMFDKPGEHFVFFLARWSFSQGRPVFIVEDTHLVSDKHLTRSWNEYSVDLDGILPSINAAVRNQYCLIEAHNHNGKLPRFSRTDRLGFETFPQYIHESLSGRPYAATVWGDDSVYGEYFLADGTTGVIRSITVVGTQINQVVSRDNDLTENEIVYDRQLAWFNNHGQKQIQRIRVGIIGCGGTGSHIVQNLAYIGCRDFVLIDPDRVETTNMNRLVTATMADVGTPKAIPAQRLIKNVAPTAQVITIEDELQSSLALETLKGVDIIFGCVDNDGARLILNDFAVAYRIPYFDVATGIDATSGQVESIGGRLAIVLPGGPCLSCMYEIDDKEAAYFLSSPEKQSEQLDRGYITGVDVPAPSVVSLNALISAVAVNEFAVFVSGIRNINVFSEYDLLGNISSRSIPAQWLSPTLQKRRDGCVTCSYSGKGDSVHLQRFLKVDAS